MIALNCSFVTRQYKLIASYSKILQLCYAPGATAQPSTQCVAVVRSACTGCSGATPERPPPAPRALVYPARPADTPRAPRAPHALCVDPLTSPPCTIFNLDWDLETSEPLKKFHLKNSRDVTIKYPALCRPNKSFPLILFNCYQIVAINCRLQ